MTANTGGLNWQQECTRELQAAVATGRTGKEQWDDFRARIPETAGRIIIADAAFDGQSLSGFDLARCYFTRTSFRNSNLSDANFAQSIFRNCDATGANIEGATFRYADMQGDGLVLDTERYDNRTNFEIERARLPDLVPQGLIDAASRAKHERLWRNRKAYSPPVRFLLWLTQHGFSLWRLTGVGVLTVLIFAAVYSVLGQPPLSSLAASVAYFINLDAAYSSGLLVVFGLAEAVLGLLFFAIMTAILVSMFFEKN